MPTTWGDAVVRFLTNSGVCPRCAARLAGIPRCASCGADLGGAAAIAVWEASQRAAEAVRARDLLVDALPQANTGSVATAAAAVVAAPTVGAGAAAGSGGWPLVAGPVAERESRVSIQSVLAVAGAGLLAVSALVFTFFNPDLADRGTRAAIVGVLALLFLGIAAVSRRRALRFSAEAIGALGAVFIGLSVWTVADLLAPAVDGWLTGAIGTLLASTLLLGLGTSLRVRTWLWTGLVAAPLVAILCGLAVGGRLGALSGWLAATAVALAAGRITGSLASRFESPLRADRITATAIQLLTTFVVLVMLPGLDVEGTIPRVLTASAVLLALTAMSALAALGSLRRTWSLLAGALAVAAVVVLIGLIPSLEFAAVVALLPTAAMVGVAAVGGTLFVRAFREPTSSGTTRLSNGAVETGALAVALGSATPAAYGLGGALVSAIFLTAGRRAEDTSRGVLEADPIGSFIPSDYGLGALVGLAAAAVALAASGILARRRGGAPAGRARMSAGVWVAGGALLALIGWSALPVLVQSSLGTAAAAALGLITLIGSGRRLSAEWRTPILVAAHAAVLLGGVLSWADDRVTVPVGITLLAALAIVGRASPRLIRPGHVVIGFGYALVLLAVALDGAGVDTLPTLSLTAAAAALVALAATLIRRVDRRYWAAVLAVTGVPFLIGVASVLLERSGWTALSTGTVLLLALALLVSRRPGLGLVVRTLAAAVIVPSLAVVVVCLGAELLAASGSPVVLPVIAVITAVSLAGAGFLSGALTARGIAEREARSAALAVEATTLLTAALAVLLALSRVAAGLDTAFVVLLLVGIGGAAARVFGRRAYGWWVAAAGWTGALWCAWALAGVRVVEPYVLPPAMAAAIVGVILLLRRERVGATSAGEPSAPTRGFRGPLALLVVGASCAVIPTLAILAIAGSALEGAVLDGAAPAGSPLGSGGPLWRTLGLLGGAVLLLLGAGVTARMRGAESATLAEARSAARRAVVTTLAIAAIVAASAGVVQGIRWGRSLDLARIVDPDLVLLPVLALGVVSAILAALAAGLIGGPQSSARRLASVPSVVFVAAGSWTAVRADWVAIWLEWALMATLLLGAIVVTFQVRRGGTSLPPALVVYGVAWLTGVAAWGPRELRVEVFSLPLGLALVAMGAIAWRMPVPEPAAASPGSTATLARWPIGFAGSWRVLAPGVGLTLLPSVLATGTDPQTWRAILVIAMALVAILAGSILRLAAPFVLGLVALPVENAIVFLVQIGRSIGALPWWITLATAGIVLLGIAVGSERKTARGGGVAARLRELR